jgi:hypothetical protein
MFSKIVELEEELRVVGNNLKSLEVSEEKVCVSCFKLSFSLIIINLTPVLEFTIILRNLKKPFILKDSSTYLLEL